MAGSYPACDLTDAVLKSRATKARLREVLGEFSEDRGGSPAFKLVHEAELFGVVAQKIRNHYQVDR